MAMRLRPRFRFPRNVLRMRPGRRKGARVSRFRRRPTRGQTNDVLISKAPSLLSLFFPNTLGVLSPLFPTAPLSFPRSLPPLPSFWLSFTLRIPNKTKSKGKKESRDVALNVVTLFPNHPQHSPNVIVRRHAAVSNVASVLMKCGQE